MKLKRYLKNLTSLALLLNLILYSGCSKGLPLNTAKSNIEQEFLNSFNKTSKLNYPLYTSTKIAGKTFWIYIATEKDILTISPASSLGGVTPEKIIKFLEIKCNYENSMFNLNYIFLKYSEEEKTKEKNIFKKTEGGGTMLYQDFTDTTIEMLQKTYFAIGDIIPKSEDMNFFAICLANIKKGMEVIFVIHKIDMEQFLLNMLPSDEFYNRMILSTKGGKDIINDKYGLHLDYNDISLTDFLREQIVNNSRAKITEMEKYDPKKIETLDKLDDLLMESMYDVTTKYEFGDYFLLEIENIITKEKTTVSKSALTNRFSQTPSIDYPL